jgi:SEC-C motif domain protein
MSFASGRSHPSERCTARLLRWIATSARRGLLDHPSGQRLGGDHPRPTPTREPIPNVAAPAAPPISSIRSPPTSARRPVNKRIAAPTPKSDAADKATLTKVPAAARARVPPLVHTRLPRRVARLAHLLRRPGGIDREPAHLHRREHRLEPPRTHAAKKHESRCIESQIGRDGGARVVYRHNSRMPPKNLCPCTSGLPYRACCGPYHRGEAEPPSPEALLRSRFSAFALRDARYLWKTLDAEHPDREHPEAEMQRVIKRSAEQLRYMRLHVLDRREPDEAGVAKVLFLAEVYDKGRNVSFIELSSFRHDGEGWRYFEGTMKAAAGIGAAAEGLTIEAFEAFEQRALKGSR